MEKSDYLKKFKRCILEYVDVSSGIEEDDTQDQGGAPMGGDPGMGGAPAGGPMGGDPGMGGDPSMGGAPGGDPMGGDPGMGGAPGGDPMGGDPNAMGGDPNAAGAPADGGGTPPEGFAPQGVDQNAGIDGMGSTPADGMGQAPQGDMQQSNDEVIDVDDLTDSQEDTEKKVDALSSKFEKVLNSIDSIEKRISDIDAHTNQYLGTLKSEFEKRNPTPMQRLTMRSTKSAPYAMSPNEYMNNYAPDNYSAADDNNGADDPQYKITKGDIDSFTDYNSIANEFNGKNNLRDILDF